MESGHNFPDPAELLASLERRHEQVLLEIDQLAERVEKTLLEYKVASPLESHHSDGQNTIDATGSNR